VARIVGSRTIGQRRRPAKTLRRTRDDSEHQPGDGGDSELAVPLLGAALAVEEFLEEGMGAGPLEDASDQDGQGLISMAISIRGGFGGGHRSVSVLQVLGV